MTDKMAASIESCCEMYKRPYLLNRSTDLHKICGKMFASLTPSYWSDSRSLWAPFKKQLHKKQNVGKNSME